MLTLIELAVPTEVPSITFLKICSWNFEVPRPALSKPGFVDIWLAKCYFDGIHYVESPLPGINIKLEGEDFDEFIQIPTTVKDLMIDSMEILSNFLISHGYLEGTVVFVEVEV